MLLILLFMNGSSMAWNHDGINFRLILMKYGMLNDFR